MGSLPDHTGRALSGGDGNTGTAADTLDALPLVRARFPARHELYAAVPHGGADTERAVTAYVPKIGDRVRPVCSPARYTKQQRALYDGKPGTVEHISGATGSGNPYVVVRLDDLARGIWFFPEELVPLEDT